MIKKVLLGILAVVVLVLAGAAIFVAVNVRAYEASVTLRYDVPLPEITRSDAPEVLARGKHLASALGACLACHGENLGGGAVEKMGPLGQFQSPNITAGRNGLLADYSDGELARLVKHGLRRDGTTVLFMPAQDFGWWPEEDVVALVSYLRTVPAVDSEPSVTKFTAMAKVLDRLDKIPLDVARRIDHQNLPVAPAPAPTAEYGAYVAKLCAGCHGGGLSGGRIPGAPPEMPMPLNLTPHQTGLEGWTFEDFEKVMRQGLRKNGQKLDPFMGIDATRNFSEVEMRALWAHLQALPPTPLGGR